MKFLHRLFHSATSPIFIRLQSIVNGSNGYFHPFIYLPTLWLNTYSRNDANRKFTDPWQTNTSIHKPTCIPLGKPVPVKRHSLNLKLTTDKRIMVVAPHRVAAINAGGVTIRSLFQIPFGPFIPGRRHFR